MKYNPDIHHRRSIRLNGYEYSDSGAYFITICTHNRECNFGDIRADAMEINDKGEMVYHWWVELINKFRNIELDEFVIMPNHFHGILCIVGADLCVCPGLEGDAKNDQKTCAGDEGRHTGLPKKINAAIRKCTDIQKGRHTGLPLQKGTETVSLPRIIQWFKTMTTNEYFRNVNEIKWQPLNGRLWQRNYYERIIRNDQELNQIREYIQNNPLQWAMDEENPDNCT